MIASRISIFVLFRVDCVHHIICIYKKISILVLFRGENHVGYDIGLQMAKVVVLE